MKNSREHYVYMATQQLTSAEKRALAGWRRQLGLRALAGEIGISHTALYRVFNGKAVRPGSVLQIRVYLDMATPERRP